MDLDWLWALAIGLMAAWALLLALLWLIKPSGTGWKALLRVVPDLVRLTRSLLEDRSVPAGVRLALVVLLVWLASPIDLVPEFIPVLGPLDDVVVAIVILRYVRRRLGPEALAARWPGTPEGLTLLRRVIG